MNWLFIVGMLAAASWLTSLFVHIEQKLKGNHEMSTNALLWQLYSFVVFGMSVISMSVIYYG